MHIKIENGARCCLAVASGLINSLDGFRLKMMPGQGILCPLNFLAFDVADHSSLAIIISPNLDNAGGIGFAEPKISD